jgi:excisionase family DNA binding protein
MFKPFRESNTGKRTMDDKEFLTVEEVAERLPVVPITVYRMVKQGRLKVYHVGKQQRFKREDVYALLRGYHEGENQYGSVCGA